MLLYWEAGRGPVPTIGGKPVHTRSSGGTALDEREMYDVPINTPRTWTNVIAGENRTTMLFEQSRINKLVRSYNLTASDWTTTGTGTRTLNAVGIYGAINTATTLDDTSAAATYRVRQVFTVANNSDPLALSFWIEKDFITSRFVGLMFDLSGGTAKEILVHLNTATGANAVVSNTGGNTHRVRDEGRWWRVELIVTNNTTGNTVVDARVFPAHGAVLGTASDAAMGKCVVGNIQLELNTKVGSAPILTTTAQGTRNVDAFYLDFPYPVCDMMIYTRHVEAGTVLETAVSDLWYIGKSDGTDARLKCYNASDLFYRTLHGQGGTEVISTLAATPAVGDVVELMTNFNDLGGVDISQAINEGAVTSGGQTSNHAMDAEWSDRKFWLNSHGTSSPGLAYFESVKVARRHYDGANNQARLEELRALKFSSQGQQVR